MSGAHEQARPGEVLHEAQGAPGMMEGPARIVLDPSHVPDDLGGDDILVGPNTDLQGAAVLVGAQRSSRRRDPSKAAAPQRASVEVCSS